MGTFLGAHSSWLVDTCTIDLCHVHHNRDHFSLFLTPCILNHILFETHPSMSGCFGDLILRPESPSVYWSWPYSMVPSWFLPASPSEDCPANQPLHPHTQILHIAPSSIYFFSGQRLPFLYIIPIYIPIGKVADVYLATSTCIYPVAIYQPTWLNREASQLNSSCQPVIETTVKQWLWGWRWNNHKPNFGNEYTVWQCNYINSNTIILVQVQGSNPV
jgi:hypothetical protein